MRFDIITIFPKIFDSYLNESLLKRAEREGLISIASHNLRNFAIDKYRKVDDRPYGGGPGMVLKVEPIYKAVSELKGNAFTSSKEKLKKSKISGLKTRIILFSLRGKKLDAKISKRLANYDRLILICGRYEGVDERVAQYVADEEISIGDYVLSGGELPALILIESVCRFIPGFLGKSESLEEFKGSYPAYTKPAEFVLPKSGKKFFPKTPTIWKVPEILRSGDHKKIAEYRKNREL